MSSKEDKKTKKKKGGKSAEGKGKEVADEAVKEEPVVETIVSSADDVAGQENVTGDVTEAEEQSSVPDPVVEEAKEEPAPEPIAAAAPVKAKKKEKEEPKVTPMDMERLIELKEAFSLFDFNHDGIIDLQDLKYTFASLGAPNFPEEEMQRMLNEATEPVDFDAFVSLFSFKVSMLDPEEVFTGALSTWDMRDVGMIPEERLKRDIRCFGDKFNSKDTDNALEEAPVFLTEGVPMIDYVKFSSNICGFRNVVRTRKYQKEMEEKEARRYEQ